MDETQVYRDDYYDGVSAKRVPGDARVEADALVVRLKEGAPLRWPLARLRRLSSADDVLRVTLEGSPARVDLRNTQTRRDVEARIGASLALEGDERGSLRRIVFWSLAATASLILTVIYLVPILADRIAPLVPPGLEMRLGDTVDGQVRHLISGEVCADEEGAAALDALTARLVEGLDLHVPVRAAVIDNPMVNAFALPGGRVYFARGMLERTRDPDEFAGVLAHEIGHVAHRDGLRRLIQTSGSAFLLGLLFGDVGGAGAVVLAGRLLVDASYSRDQERAADAFAADRMEALGRPPQALGALLLRVGGGRSGGALDFFSSHPMSEERMQALEGREAPERGPPLLDEAQWRALRGICG